MTVNNSSSQEKASDPFAYLHKYKHLQLTTFRKNGTAVPTTVWFAPYDGKLDMMTAQKTGKVKRIRNNGRVLLAPCTVQGKVLGEQIEAHARELPPGEYGRAISLLARKYGLLYQIVAFSEKLRKIEKTYFEIEPV